MKTKSLVMTAAVAMAGAISSYAQVYSVNVVGYINLTVPAGYSMIANQLNASPDNTVTNIFKSAPSDFTVFKFNPLTSSYIAITALGGGEWDPIDNAGLTLSPGEGCFAFSPSAFTNTFVGEISSTNSISIRAGYNIYSSPLPLAGAVDTALSMPIGADDTVFIWKPITRSYDGDTYLGEGAWDGSSGGVAPTVQVGQAFWYLNAGLAKNWTKNYTP